MPNQGEGFNNIGGRIASANHFVRLKNSIDQSLANGVLISLSFDTQIAGHSNVNGLPLWAISSPTQILIRSNGIYHISGNVAWTSSALGVRELEITVNGTIIATVDDVPITGFIHGHGISAIANLLAGDIVLFQAIQTSGGPINVINAVNSPFFCVSELVRL
jgi:hypothetical protein